jgi:Flp pilus assembly protein TadG
MFLTQLKKYIQDTRGAIAVAFAIMTPIIIGAAGLAIDYSQAYMVQQRLHQAIDAAALAGVASDTDESAVEAKIIEFFNVNYPPEKIGATYDPVVTFDGNEITVAGNAQYNTYFLRIFGIDDITIEAETVVQRLVQGLEVVLVMDNTGSMASNNNIGTLRTAATNFVNILFANTSNPETIKIGLVPYSTSVNVGSYGLGENPDGSYYDTPFVNNPHDLDYSTSNSSQWQGCVLANAYDDDTTDNEGPWDMYRYCRDESENVVCDYYRQRTCTGRRRNRRCTYENVARRNANYICPDTSIMPLSSDQDALLDQIDTMRADGWTLGNYGMVWGYRVLTPEYPFEEATDWDNELWQKAAVMMTDGVNTMHSYYTAYGPTADHDIGPSDLNERFAEVCENMKDQGITLYTITFAGGVNENTKEYYRNCATSEDQYYDAPSQDDLIDVFETISRELSNLYIKS